MFHTVQLSKSDPTPLYIQLASELAKLIQGELLVGGTKLPPIRYLSQQLAINRDTVVSAYKLLENQGLVEGHIGKGTYVLPQGKLIPMSPMKKEASSQICCSHLGFSEKYFPRTLCEELTSQIVKLEGWDAFSDPHYRERHFLRQSISQFLEHVGVHAHFAQVRAISNLDDFFLSLFKYSPKPGICIETPRDLLPSCSFRSLGAKLFEIPLTEDGLDLDLLEKQLKTGLISYIYLMPYAQNPTGLCYSMSQKQKILELADTYDCYIIEDGTYSEFLYSSSTASPLYKTSKSDRIIYLFHFSKLYLPYLSYSFAVLPTAMNKRMPDQTTSTFNDRLLRYYLESDFLKNLRNDLFNSCKENYYALYNVLKLKHQHYTFKAYEAGLSFWIKPLYTSSEAFCNRLANEHIIASPGTLFINSSQSDYVRLSISRLTSLELKKLIQLL